jgi:hypothetical protein
MSAPFWKLQISTSMSKARSIEANTWKEQTKNRIIKKNPIAVGVCQAELLQEQKEPGERLSSGIGSASVTLMRDEGNKKTSSSLVLHLSSLST